MINNYRIPLPPSGNRGVTLLFSLPQTNHYQSISNLLTPKGRIFPETKWKNKIFSSTLNDVVQNKKNITLKAKLHPYKNYVEEKWTLNDYSVKPENNRFINGLDPKIIDLKNKAVEKEINLFKTINKLYLFSRNYLKYGKPIEGLYTYKQAMEERITDCGGYSTFMASLLAAAQIPSRLVVGYIVKKYLVFKRLSIHAWLEILLPNGEWFPVDAATGKFGALPANRLVTSFGCDFEIKINGKKYVIDLLQNPIYI